MIQQSINQLLTTASFAARLSPQYDQLQSKNAAKSAFKGLQDIHQNIKEGKFETYSDIQKQDVINRVRSFNTQYQDYRARYGEYEGFTPGKDYANMMKEMETKFGEYENSQHQEKLGQRIEDAKIRNQALHEQDMQFRKERSNQKIENSQLESIAKIDNKIEEMKSINHERRYQAKLNANAAAKLKAQQNLQNQGQNQITQKENLSNLNENIKAPEATPLQQTPLQSPEATTALQNMQDNGIMAVEQKDDLKNNLNDISNKLSDINLQLQNSNIYNIKKDFKNAYDKRVKEENDIYSKYYGESSSYNLNEEAGWKKAIKYLDELDISYDLDEIIKDSKTYYRYSYSHINGDPDKDNYTPYRESKMEAMGDLLNYSSTAGSDSIADFYQKQLNDVKKNKRRH